MSAPTDTSASTPQSAAQFDVDATVITTNSVAVVDDALGNEPTVGCEDLDDKYAALGLGKAIAIKNAAGEIIGAAELTEAAMEAPPNVCVWDASFVGIASDEGPFTATIGSWESEPRPASELEKLPLVVQAD